MGRLPIELRDLRDDAMDNAALAMDEEQLSREALKLIDRWKTTFIEAAKDSVITFDELTDCLVGFNQVRRCVEKQLAIDLEDQATARRIDQHIEVLIEGRRPLGKAALKHSATL